MLRKMCEKLTSIQRHTHPDYKNPRVLRDQTISAADIGNVSCALKEHISSAAHEALQKIATFLSSQPRSSGSQADAASEAYYGLGRRFGARAGCKFSSSRNK